MNACLRLCLDTLTIHKRQSQRSIRPSQNAVLRRLQPLRQLLVYSLLMALFGTIDEPLCFEEEIRRRPLPRTDTTLCVNYLLGILSALFLPKSTKTHSLPWNGRAVEAQARIIREMLQAHPHLPWTFRYHYLGHRNYRSHGVC